MTRKSRRHPFYYKSESIKLPLTEMSSPEWHFRDLHWQKADKK